MDSGHFWLCNTPHQAAVSYEAKGPYGRIVTWAALQHQKTKPVFACYNAHVDAEKRGVFENYDSRTGRGLDKKDRIRCNNFSWSGVFTIEFILGWEEE